MEYLGNAFVSFRTRDIYQPEMVKGKGRGRGTPTDMWNRIRGTRKTGCMNPLPECAPCDNSPAQIPAPEKENQSAHLFCFMFSFLSFNPNAWYYPPQVSQQKQGKAGETAPGGRALSHSSVTAEPTRPTTPSVGSGLAPVHKSAERPSPGSCLNAIGTEPRASY